MKKLIYLKFECLYQIWYKLYIILTQAQVIADGNIYKV